MAKRVSVDRWLFGVTLVLVLIGLVMIFSASAEMRDPKAWRATTSTGDLNWQPTRHRRLGEARSYAACSRTLIGTSDRADRGMCGCRGMSEGATVHAAVSQRRWSITSSDKAGQAVAQHRISSASIGSDGVSRPASGVKSRGVVFDGRRVIFDG